MLSDRSYMREDYRPERTSFLIWLLCAIVAGFVIQNVFAVWLQRADFEHLTALSTAGLRHGYVWTLLTFPLLQDNILQLIMVGLGLFFLGRELQGELGDRRLAGLSAATLILAGAVWTAVNFARGGELTGATSLLLAYLTAFACLHPDRPISFLVFFVFPVTTRPKYVAWLLAFVSVLGVAFLELPSSGPRSGVPHSAHLGGMLAGWLFYHLVQEGGWWSQRRAAAAATRAVSRRPGPVPASTPLSSPRAAEPAATAALRADIDRILDKINSHGFGSLTPEEKRRLDDARDLLSRR
jgi:membrane associated rhomboid family serine protease